MTDDLRERLARAMWMDTNDAPAEAWPRREDAEKAIYLGNADAVFAEITAAGYAVVPMDATEEMLECGGRTAFPVTLALGAKAPQSARYRASDIWQAMLAANPLTPSK